MGTNAIENLVDRGHDFINRTALQLNSREYLLHSVTAHVLSDESSNDGTRHEIATDLVQHDVPHPAQNHLDKPLWTWNGSITRPAFEATQNPLVNTSWCSPQATINIAIGILEGTIMCTPEVKDKMLDRIGATFFAEATPRRLMSDLDDEVGFICRDDEYPGMHVASASLFFGAIASKKLLAFDVHDITHHSIQMQRWPDFFTRVGSIGYNVFRKKASSESSSSSYSNLGKHLVGLVVDAVFEESLLEENGQLHSFGCLNWLAPRDTPASEMGSTRVTSDEQLLLSQKWHSLYALKDLYRTQQRASEELGIPLDWVQQLGYDADQKFKRLSEQPHNAPLANLDVSDAYHIEVSAPNTPDELISNAVTLFRKYGFWTDQKRTT